MALSVKAKAPGNARREIISVGAVAVAITCKTPTIGLSKTRLSPPLRPAECAALSACFIRDVSETIATLSDDGDVACYALYTPRGSEAALRQLLPERFRLIPQRDGELGVRLLHAITGLLQAGHAGAILVNSDSPTLPPGILRQAADAARSGDNVVLGPAIDGGYTLIGMSKPHARLFEDIPWSTPEVYRLTLARAREIGLRVCATPPWYDVDDAASFRMLEAELAGARPDFADEAAPAAEARATRRFLLERRSGPAATA